MRPTTKDLAKAAGVSLATVDRVLNARPGVRQETVDAVNEAIDRIGFVRNLLAANLARGRTYRLEFLLPETGDQFLSALEDRIDEAAAGFASEAVELRRSRVIGSDPHRIAAVLARIDPGRADGVAIMAPEAPLVRDAITRLRERGVQVVQLLSGRPGDDPFDFVGIDNKAAGATAARLLGRFAAGRQGSILVISDRMNARDSVERRQGFDRVMGTDFPRLAALPSLETYGDPVRTLQVVANAYRNHHDIVGVYVLSSEARLALEAVARVADPLAQIIIAHERTGFTESLLLNGQLDALIAQNPGHLVRSAIRLLRAGCDGREPLASQEEIRIEILLKENLGTLCARRDLRAAS